MINRLKAWIGRSSEYPSFYREYLDSLKVSRNLDIDKIRFLVVDTETTGLVPAKDHILSIGVVTVEGNALPMQRSWYAQFPHYDREKKESIEVHGILPNIQKGLNANEILQQFLEMAKGAVLVAHHAAFDIAMINKALKEEGLGPVKNKILDTVQLAKRVDHGPFGNQHSRSEDYSLDTLCDKYAIPMKHRHNAAGDAYLTAILLLKLLHILRSKGIRELRELYK